MSFIWKQTTENPCGTPITVLSMYSGEVLLMTVKSSGNRWRIADTFKSSLAYDCIRPDGLKSSTDLATVRAACEEAGRRFLDAMNVIPKEAK